MLASDLSAALGALSEARRIADDIRSLPDDMPLVDGWKEFITAAGRVRFQIKRAMDGKAAGPWPARFSESLTLPVIQYIQRSRDVHEHKHDVMLAALRVDLQPMGPPVVLAASFTMVNDLGEKTTHLPQPSPVFAIKGQWIDMLPVESRGVTYSVPTEHLGTAISKATPSGLADIFVGYYTGFLGEMRFWLIAEARKRAGKPPL